MRVGKNIMTNFTVNKNEIEKDLHTLYGFDFDYRTLDNSTVKMISKPHYMLDLETTTYTTSKKESRVYYSGYMRIDGKFDDFGDTTNFDEFMKWLVYNQGLNYFHNLKFDGKFLVPWLEMNGFKFVIGGEDKKEDKSYSVIIDNVGNWYGIDINVKVKRKGKKPIIVTTSIWDSAKKIPLSVKNMASSYKLPIVKLGDDYDYHMYRDENWKPSELETEYLKNDLSIVARVLWMGYENKRFKRTISADALLDYKETMYPYGKYEKALKRYSESNIRKAERKGKELTVEESEKGFFTYKQKMENEFRNFERNYPILPVDTNAYIKRAYLGGMTYANPIYKGELIKEVSSYDVNSMYPGIMLNEILPYGEPVEMIEGVDFEEDEINVDSNFPLSIFRVKFSFELKYNHIPFIQIKNSPYFNSNVHLTSSDNLVVDMHVTNIDWERIIKHYHIDDVEIVNGIKFKADNKHFKEYIDKHGERKIRGKVEKKVGVTQDAKNMLNCLYGKMGSNDKLSGKVVDNSGEFTKYIDRTNDNEEIIEKEIEAQYMSVAVFTTAYGRSKVIKAGQDNFDRFLYMDTDSVHLIGFEQPDLDMHDTELGKWGREGDSLEARFNGAKRYFKLKCMDENGDETTIDKMSYVKELYKCAGAPEQTTVRFTKDNFVNGTRFLPEFKCKKTGKIYNNYKDFKRGDDIIFECKFTTKTVKGGVLLCPSSFELGDSHISKIRNIERTIEMELEKRNPSEKRIASLQNKLNMEIEKHNNDVIERAKDFEGEAFENMINNMTIKIKNDWLETLEEERKMFA